MEILLQFADDDGNGNGDHHHHYTVLYWNCRIGKRMVITRSQKSSGSSSSGNFDVFFKFECLLFFIFFLLQN